MKSVSPPFRLPAKKIPPARRDFQDGLLDGKCAARVPAQDLETLSISATFAMTLAVMRSQRPPANAKASP
jgi:hypothetical protein